MKKLLFFITLTAFAVSANAQTATYGKIEKGGQYSSYIAKNGDHIELGDTLVLGRSSSDLGYMYITQGGLRMNASHAGKSVVVAKMKAFGNKRQGYKLYLQFKGYGMPVNIDYDNALETGEIINEKSAKTQAKN